MIECQHSFDGKALFTVWLLMIVLGGSGCSSAVPPRYPRHNLPEGFFIQVFMASLNLLIDTFNAEEIFSS